MAAPGVPAVRLVVPKGGVVLSRPITELDPAELADALNVIVFDGALRSRPPYTLMAQTGPTARVMGGVTYRDAAGARVTVCGTTAGFFELGGAAWTDRTGTALTGGKGNHVRFAVFQSGSPATISVYFVNDVDAPRKWTGTGNSAALAGSPPIARDIMPLANRLVLVNTTSGGTRSPANVRVSDFNDPATWPATNEANLGDEQDHIIAAVRMTGISGAIYQRKAIWMAIQERGTFPLRFELRDRKPGPVSAAAVVDDGAVHYYLGEDLNVWSFDGQSAKPVGNSIRKFIEDNIDFDNRGRSFGVLHQRHRYAYWVFPNATSSGDPKSAVSLDLRTGAFWPHLFTNVFTSGWSFDVVFADQWDTFGSTATWNTISQSTWNDFNASGFPSTIMGGLTRTYQFGVGTGDDGATRTTFWLTGLLPVAGPAEQARVGTVESLYAKAGGAATITVKTGITNTGITPVLGTGTNHDLATDSEKKHQPTDQIGRFLQVEHRGTTDVEVEYRGGNVFAFPSPGRSL